MNRLAPYRSRGAVLEAIGTAAALAETANSTDEHLHWSSRASELRARLDTLTEAEERTLEAVKAGRVAIYTSEMSS